MNSCIGPLGKISHFLIICEPGQNSCFQIDQEGGLTPVVHPLLSYRAPHPGSLDRFLRPTRPLQLFRFMYYVFKDGPTQGSLLCLFVFKILGTSRIRIQIVGVEGKDADH